jgi:hypothetical protein
MFHPVDMQPDRRQQLVVRSLPPEPLASPGKTVLGVPNYCLQNAARVRSAQKLRRVQCPLEHMESASVAVPTAFDLESQRMAVEPLERFVFHPPIHTLIEPTT